MNVNSLTERQTEFQRIMERTKLASEMREQAEQAMIRQNEQIQQELDMAAEFQRAVLPRDTNLPYLDTAIIYQPYAEVSGDVYDFLQNREGELAVFLGDATGHGIAAALMTMMIHIGLDGIRRNLPTHESLRILNKLLASRNTGRSVSGVFFRVTPEGRLSVTHAGHPSLIVLPKQGGAAVQFEKGGCALGIFEDEPVPYEEEYWQLEDGDKLIAYTDAAIEWSNPRREAYGLQRLLTLASNKRGESVKDLSAALINELREFTEGTHCNDDLTVLVLEYRAV